MSIIHQVKRMIRLDAKKNAEKIEWMNRPYTQKVYDKEDQKKFPHNPDKWRVIKTIQHKGGNNRI